MLVFHTHTCLLIACLHLAYSPLHIMLAYLHLHTLTLAYFALGCFRSSSVRVCVSVEMSVCKCKCRSVSVQGIFRKNPSQCFREKETFPLASQVAETMSAAGEAFADAEDGCGKAFADAKLLHSTVFVKLGEIPGSQRASCCQASRSCLGEEAGN